MCVAIHVTGKFLLIIEEYSEITYLRILGTMKMMSFNRDKLGFHFGEQRS